jgi:peptidyl-prolyl cis-trans isomerase C
VGSELVSSRSVRRIAQAQGVPPQRALELAIFDALFAEAARSSSAAGTVPVIERAAVARGLLEQLGREATAAGPPTQAELGELAAARWLEIDRPDAVRTTHAIILNDQPARAVAARALAEKRAEAVRSAASSDEFVRLAKALPHEGFELKAEALSPVTADGRGFEKRETGFVGRGSFDKSFAAAANALTRPGEQSPVVESKFGFHVIRLEERIPGSIVPKDQLPALLAPDVMTQRADRARQALLDELRKGAAIEIDRAAEELLSRAKIEQ